MKKHKSYKGTSEEIDEKTKGTLVQLQRCNDNIIPIIAGQGVHVRFLSYEKEFFTISFIKEL
jgi:hypothetical protein